MPEIATIGYEGVGLETFIDALLAAKVRQVLDIRELPLSRRKGFSKTALSTALAENGIDYFHLKSLGDPKPGRDAAKAGRDREFRRIFSNHMKTDEAQQGLALCAKLAKAKPSALLCFERCHKCCHRSIVADALRLAYGFRVQHIDTVGASYGSTAGGRSNSTRQSRPSSRS